MLASSCSVGTNSTSRFNKGCSIANKLAPIASINARHNIKSPNVACNGFYPTPKSVRILNQARQQFYLRASEVKLKVDQVRDKCTNFIPEMVTSDTLGVREQLCVNSARILVACALPLAKIALKTDYSLQMARAVHSFIRLYLLFIFIRVLLTWFPSLDWNVQPFVIIRLVSDPYLNLFRNFIPPLFGQIDFTPMIGFFVLQILSDFINPSHHHHAYSYLHPAHFHSSTYLLNM
mmetsp:Transcript_19389/g.35006  ORF Transcript_19389/g.35006 Transcript_19389/m.35006 type:complete len:234 (+) Transcript_19389:69-770(+)